MKLFIVEIKLARGGLDRPGKNLDQGRFPRPIFTDQGMHSPAVEDEADVIQRAGSGIIFGDMFRADL